MDIHQVSSVDFDLQKKIAQELEPLNFIYPDFKDWLTQKVFRQLITDMRKIFVAQENEIICGILILKDTDEEKKICTLRVTPRYSRLGIGSQLIKLAQSELKTEYPVITVSEKHREEFRPIFEKFEFSFHQRYFNYYKEETTEYSYNGPIEPGESNTFYKTS